MSSPGSLKSAVDSTAEPHDGVWRGAVSRVPGGARTLWVLLGLILLGLVVWALWPGASRTGRLGMGGPQAVGVANATSGAMNITINALGTVTPLATVTVRPQVGGQLMKFYFTEGQLVKAGDMLALIDPRPFQAALAQAQGQLARDQANLDNAIVDLNRQKGLMAAKATSDQQYATQLALVESDRGVVKSDQANVQTAAINLGFTRITSPVDGRVGLRQVDVGNTVSAGQTNGIVVVTQEKPISVLFTVPEDNIGDIMDRVNAGAKLTVFAYDRGQTKLLATGVLATVDNQIDTTTGTVKLRAQFDNANGELFPNQFVNVQLLVNTLQDQTLVPVAAVQRGAEGNYVFVVQPDKTVAQRTVAVGPGDAKNVTVTSGLKPGDTVVVDGADRLRDGAQVELPNATAPIGKPSAPAAANGAAAPDAGPAARRAKMQAALKQYCAADIAKYCPNVAPGRETMMCVFQNRDSFSDACQGALKKFHRGGGHHGGGGGGGP
ncbi:MAG: MdtA/MuxA family multidrug efflux RND transporter periplasmic adaptor subunit [Rhizomicrobium sp.]